MPQVTVPPGATFPFPIGTGGITIQNTGNRIGQCNVFTEFGSQNFQLNPGQVKATQLGGGEGACLDNTGKTSLLVTFQ